MANGLSCDDMTAQSLPLRGYVRRATLGWLALTYLWAATVLLVPVLVLGTSTSSLPWETAAAAALVQVYAGTRFALIVGGGRPRPLAGSFWLFTLVAMGIAPLSQIATGLRPALVDQKYLLPATVLVLLGLLAYDAGAALARLRPSSHLHRTQTISDARLVVLTIVAFAGAAYHIIESGGISGLFVTRETALEAARASGPVTSQAAPAIISALGTVPQIVALIAWTNVLVRDRARRTVNARAVWLALLALNLVVNNPMIRSRHWFLTVVVGLMLGLPGLTSRRFRAVMALGVICAVMVLPYSDIFRVNAENRKPLGTDSIVETLSVKDYDQLTMFANTIWWSESNGLQLGRQLSGEVFFWVPRAMWPNKPYDTGVIVGRAMQLSNVNLSAPLWAEFYIDFGVSGLLVGFVMFGYMTKRLDEAFANSISTTRARVLAIDVAVPLLAGYQFILLRGPLLQAMGRFSVLLLCGWFLLRPATARSDVR